MKALVTGAGGTAGSYVVRHLVDHGFSVRALMDPGDGATALSVSQVERVPGSVLDLESVHNALADIQAVFHCHSSYECWTHGPLSARSLNVDGTRNVLVAMARAGVEKLVHVGSAFSYAPGTLTEPGTEEESPGGASALPALSPSARSARELVSRYGESGRLRCVMVGPTLVMGEETSGTGPVTAILRYVADGNRFYPPGGINVVAAADVASAALKALGRGSVGGSYILGGFNISYRELMYRAASALGVPAPSRHASPGRLLARGRASSALGRLTGRAPALTAELARLTATTLYYSSDRASRELGYEPGPLVPAIEDACAWFSEHWRNR